MATNEKDLRFGQSIMPHLDAAYNLARWLLRNDADAEEAVQEAFLRAYRFFGSFRGEDGKAWLFAIVRNTCYSLHGERMGAGMSEEFDEQLHSPVGDSVGAVGGLCRDPADIAIEHADRERVNRAIEDLPVVFREVLVMRELEELSYRKIATIVDIPMGTVMSRLSRGRQMLHAALVAMDGKESMK